MIAIFEFGQPRLQKEFLEHTESWMRVSYQIAACDTILCALWLGKRLRKGFVITDKAVYWRLGSGETQSCGGLQKADCNGAADFSMETLLPEAAGLSPEEIGQDRLTKLTVRTDKVEQSFYFKKLDEIQAEATLDILKYGFNQGVVPQVDLGGVIAEAKPSKIQAIVDLFVVGCNDFKKKTTERLSSIQGGVKGRFRKQRPTDNGAAESVAATSTSSIRRFFAHFFDFLASLIFIFAVIVAVKPELLDGMSFDRQISQGFFQVGSNLFRIKTWESVAGNLALARNFFVAASFVAFLGLKILVVILSQGTKRFVAFLTLALTVLSCWLVADKFLLFIAFCLLLNICFQALCDFGGKAIFRKLVWLLVAAMIGYVTFHIAGLESVRAILGRIGNHLAAIGGLLAEFFRQLVFPVWWW